jgi:N4-gp56 family major capsid protein
MADFTTVMTSTGEVDDSIIEEFDRQFIVAAADEGVMDQFVSYRKAVDGKSVEFPKYAQLSLQTSPLLEKEDPASEALSDSQIIFTPAEYGNVVTTTKLSNLQSGGRADLAAARLTGINGQRSLDKLAILAAEASSNELTPGGVGEGALTASDVMTASFLNELYNKLARASIAPLSEGMYVAVMHDDQIFDLRDSAGSGSWQDINKYARPEEVLRNEVGMISGFRIVRDNNVTINTDAGAATVDSYHAICMGFNALGKAESSPLMQRITGPFDKLGRFVNIGWHWVGEYGIVDQDALYLGTTASSVGAN